MRNWIVCGMILGGLAFPAAAGAAESSQLLPQEKQLMNQGFRARTLIQRDQKENDRLVTFFNGDSDNLEVMKRVAKFEKKNINKDGGWIDSQIVTKVMYYVTQQDQVHRSQLVEVEKITPVNLIAAPSAEPLKATERNRNR